MNKTASLLFLLLPLAGCVADESDPDFAETEQAIDDDPDPPEEIPPTAPTTSFRPTARTNNSVTLRWVTPYDVTSTFVQRRTTGAWSTVKTYGVTTGTVTFENTGLTQDTRYCYRVVVQNAGGSAMTPEKCVLTDHPNNELVYRVQLELDVADVSGAGTDDRIAVSLNDTYFGNFTRLNYSHDDVELGSEFTYDLLQMNITQLYDVSQIKLTKWGTDSLCLKSLRLILDNQTAFVKFFGNTASTCRMINGTTGQSNTLLIPRSELRAEPSFVNWQSNFDFVIPHDEIVSRIEGIVGDLVWKGDAYWGQLHGPAVEVVRSPYNDSRLNIDLDLAGHAWGPNPEVDVDLTFEVGFEQDAATDDWLLVFEVVWFEVDVDLAIWEKVIIALGTPVCGPVTGEDCVTLIETHFEDMATDGFTGLSKSINLGQADCTPTVAIIGDLDQPDLLFGCD